MTTVLYKHFVLFLKVASIMFVVGAISVSGAVAQQPSKNVRMVTKDDYRYMSAAGVPDHKIGTFPSPNAPYTLAPQEYAFRMPKTPVKSATPSYLSGDLAFGVALNGVPFHGPMEVVNNAGNAVPMNVMSGKRGFGLDGQNGHVGPNGAYHYHGIPKVLLKKDFMHVGYAADGFPIFVSQSGKFKSSYVLRDGQREDGSGPYNGLYTTDYGYKKGAGNLDRCNGVRVNKKYYIYVLTEAFPHVPLCWSGTPDKSFQIVMPTTDDTPAGAGSVYENARRVRGSGGR